MFGHFYKRVKKQQKIIFSVTIIMESLGALEKIQLVSRSFHLHLWKKVTAKFAGRAP